MEKEQRPKFFYSRTIVASTRALLHAESTGRMLLLLLAIQGNRVFAQCQNRTMPKGKIKNTTIAPVSNMILYTVVKKSRASIGDLWAGKGCNKAGSHQTQKERPTTKITSRKADKKMSLSTVFLIMTFSSMNRRYRDFSRFYRTSQQSSQSKSSFSVCRSFKKWRRSVRY